MNAFAIPCFNEAESSMFLNTPLVFSSPLFQLQKAESSEADEADEDPAVVQSAQVFAPKSLVLVSRLDHTEVFKVRYTTIIHPGSGIIKQIPVYMQESIRPLLTAWCHLPGPSFFWKLEKC